MAGSKCAQCGSDADRSRWLQEAFISAKDAKDGTLTKKAEEFKRFEVSLEAKRAQIDTDSIALVRKFEKKKKQLLRQLEEDNMPEEEAIAKLKDLEQANVLLNDDLLELQLRQMDADDSILSEFEQRYASQKPCYFRANLSVARGGSDVGSRMKHRAGGICAGGSVQHVVESTRYRAYRAGSMESKEVVTSRRCTQQEVPGTRYDLMLVS